MGRHRELLRLVRLMRVQRRWRIRCRRRGAVIISVPSGAPPVVT